MQLISFQDHEHSLLPIYVWGHRYLLMLGFVHTFSGLDVRTYDLAFNKYLLCIFPPKHSSPLLASCLYCHSCPALICMSKPVVSVRNGTSQRL